MLSAAACAPLYPHPILSCMCHCYHVWWFVLSHSLPSVHAYKYKCFILPCPANSHQSSVCVFSKAWLSYLLCQSSLSCKNYSQFESVASNDNVIGGRGLTIFTRAPPCIKSWTCPCYDNAVRCSNVAQYRRCAPQFISVWIEPTMTPPPPLTDSILYRMHLSNCNSNLFSNSVWLCHICRR